MISNSKIRTPAPPQHINSESALRPPAESCRESRALRTVPWLQGPHTHSHVSLFPCPCLPLHLFMFLLSFSPLLTAAQNVGLLVTLSSLLVPCINAPLVQNLFKENQAAYDGLRLRAYERNTPWIIKSFTCCDNFQNKDHFKKTTMSHMHESAQENPKIGGATDQIQLSFPPATSSESLQLSTRGDLWSCSSSQNLFLLNA